MTEQEYHLAIKEVFEEEGKKITDEGIKIVANDLLNFVEVLAVETN